MRGGEKKLTMNLSNEDEAGPRWAIEYGVREQWCLPIRE